MFNTLRTLSIFQFENNLSRAGKCVLEFKRFIRFWLKSLSKAKRTSFQKYSVTYFCRRFNFLPDVDGIFYATPINGDSYKSYF